MGAAPRGVLLRYRLRGHPLRPSAGPAGAGLAPRQQRARARPGRRFPLGRAVARPAPARPGAGRAAAEPAGVALAKQPAAPDRVWARAQAAAGRGPARLPPGERLAWAPLRPPAASATARLPAQPVHRAWRGTWLAGARWGWWPALRCAALPAGAMLPAARQQPAGAAAQVHARLAGPAGRAAGPGAGSGAGQGAGRRGRERHDPRGWACPRSGRLAQPPPSSPAAAPAPRVVVAAQRGRVEPPPLWRQGQWEGQRARRPSPFPAPAFGQSRSLPPARLCWRPGRFPAAPPHSGAGRWARAMWRWPCCSIRSGGKAQALCHPLGRPGRRRLPPTRQELPAPGSIAPAGPAQGWHAGCTRPRGPFKRSPVPCPCSDRSPPPSAA